MFKSKVVMVVFALSLCCLAQANPNHSDLEEEVLNSFQSLVEASKRLDAEAYFQHFDADKFVGLNSDGTNWNSMDELVPVINTGFSAIQKLNSLEFLNVKVSIIDDFTAILVNEFSQSVLLKSGATYTFSGGGTQVWSKRSGQWKLVSVSASITPSANK
ncbi:MAG: hypothetical protein CL595_06120 [Alteromonas sp.]|nr:hypothetical protein [Alteromonas sp.]